MYFTKLIFCDNVFGIVLMPKNLLFGEFIFSNKVFVSYILTGGFKFCCIIVVVLSLLSNIKAT